MLETRTHDNYMEVYSSSLPVSWLLSRDTISSEVRDAHEVMDCNVPDNSNSMAEY